MQRCWDFDGSEPPSSEGEYAASEQLWVDGLPRRPALKKQTDGAARLSRNRAAKRATTDFVLQQHTSTLYHMNRRVAEMWTKAGLLPRQAQRSPGHLSARPGSSVGAYWGEEVPAAPQRRPATAPAVRTAYCTQQPAAAAAAAPEILYGPSTSFSERRVKASAQAMRAAILSEITERRCYDQARLRQLLKSYLTLNSGEAFYATLEKVVASLRDELGV